MSKSSWTTFSVVLIVACLLPGCGGSAGIRTTSSIEQFVPPPQLALEVFVSGFSSPVSFEAPDDGTNRIFILEQGGAIRTIQAGVVLPVPFLDISSQIVSGGETGLLGMVCHPNFTASGRFYVDYTRQLSTGQLQTVISEFAVSTVDPNQADPSSERQLLVVDQPYANHNGGQLAFGAGGFLYVALGDGGSGGDPSGNAQNTNVLLGKILRIDVDPPFASGKQYAIPSDNPFSGGGGLPEIWAYGFRNPWRFSFDRSNGQLIAGDVGQGAWEEVDLVVKGGNYGWNIMEGNHCYPPSVANCGMAGLTLPIAEYGHDASGGSSIIGGYVYRGSAVADLEGTYVFGDLSSGRVWALKQDAMLTWHMTQVLTHNLTVSSFGQDAAGELYLLDYGNGAVLRLRAAP